MLIEALGGSLGALTPPPPLMRGSIAAEVQLLVELHSTVVPIMFDAPQLVDVLPRQPVLFRAPYHYVYVMRGGAAVL